MNKCLYLIALQLLLHQFTLGQDKSGRQQLSISVPFIWNNTTVSENVKLSGRALSTGLGISYERNIGRNVFLGAGIGYFSQNFGIARNFNFGGDSAKYGYTTRDYKYRSISWTIEAGYTKKINELYDVRGSVAFTGLQTFRQKYNPVRLTPTAYRTSEIRKEFRPFGQMLTLNAGVDRKLSRRLYAGAEVMVPAYTAWRKDSIFGETETGTYRSGAGIGGRLSIRYRW